MIRYLIACCCTVLLSACWGAETPLFGTADWTRPGGLEGRFSIEKAEGEADGTLVLTPRADGRIDGTATRKGLADPQATPVGFVAIPGGAGHHFLMVQQVAPDKGGELYLIARWQDDRLEAYWPECKGTHDMPGMRRDKIEFLPESICVFATRQAVLRAALAAERELTARRIIPPRIVGKLRRADTAEVVETPRPPDVPTG